MPGQKRIKHDAYASPGLNHADMRVYTGNRNMCVDLSVFPTADEDLSAEELRRMEVVTMRVDDIDGNPMDGFEHALWSEGGPLGA